MSTQKTGSSPSIPPDQGLPLSVVQSEKKGDETIETIQEVHGKVLEKFNNLPLSGAFNTSFKWTLLGGKSRVFGDQLNRVYFQFLLVFLYEPHLPTNFGETLEIRDSKTDTKSRAESLYNDVANRLSSPEPLTTDEIKQLHAEVFSEEFSAISNEKKENDNHPCSILSDLYEVVLAYEVDPSKAKKPTGGETGRGVNGSYFLLNSQGEKKWVIKPEEEEKENVTSGIPKGEGARREHLAYLLNKEGIYKIPTTLYINLGGNIASVQKFVPKAKALGALASEENGQEKVKNLSKKDLQAILVFDLLFFNTDRHGGNILVSEEGKLFAIDHGGCLSSSSEDTLKIEQRNLPQIEAAEWDGEVLKHLLSLDENEVTLIGAQLAVYDIPEPTVIRMKNAASILNEAARINAESKLNGKPEISPYDIAFIFLNEDNSIWSPEKANAIRLFLRDIVSQKELLAAIPAESTNATARIIKIQRSYANSADPRSVELLYGNLTNTSNKIYWADSILGKFKQSA